MKQLRTVEPAQRPAMGKAINELKQKVQADYDAAAGRVGQAELAARNAAETVDITLPAKMRPAGGLHPLTLVRNQIIDAFAGMGFEIYEGPEIEDDDHCFTRLNVPKDHPARDMQDTFYLTDELLLRTQTSTGQIRTMDAERPPIKVLVPGRVFRSDSDATHSPMFPPDGGPGGGQGHHPVRLAGHAGRVCPAAVRHRGAHPAAPVPTSPFTEPSVEVDVSCFACHGKGCSLCKHTAGSRFWAAAWSTRRCCATANIDPEVYSGIAFGIGIERIAMLKYGINNIGLMFENDLRFLGQFHE